MPVTTIADLQIVPSKFTAYTLERTTEKSMLVKSGIVTSDPTVSQIINGTPKGGNLITMPFYNPLSGEDEVFGEEEIGVDKITTDNEVATLLVRQKAWGDTDLSKVFGGTDPINAIANLIADWWNEREQAIMLAVLKGILDPATGALKEHVLDVSGASGTDAIIGVDNTLDAKQLMGDAYDKLGMVFMHSATYTQLQKQQQIETEYDSDLKIKIDYYLGYQVVVDDEMPYDAESKTFMTYFLGKGVFARDDGMPAGLVGTETDRNKRKAENILINRRALVLHPLGVSWNPSAQMDNGKKYASNNNLSTPANWIRKKALKNIPIVALKHKIASSSTSVPVTPTLGELTVQSVEGSESGQTKITVSPEKADGNSYKYKVAASPTMPTYGQTCTSGYTAWDGTSEIAATTGQKIVVVEVDASNKAVAAGMADVTAKA